MKYVLIGKIVNTHGLKGEVRIISNFEYKDRVVTNANARLAFVNIKDINTRVEFSGDNDSMSVKEGIAFSPNFKLMFQKSIKKGEVKSCLNLRKVN